MNVVVSVSGRFHAFHLARQLQRRGHLKQLITSFPKFEVKKHGLQTGDVSGLVPYEIARRIITRVPQLAAIGFPDNVGLADFFDRHVASKLTCDVDVFVGWSGSSLRCIRRARQLGIPTVLVRGSTHILYQKEILEDEYRRWGVKLRPVDPRVFDRELIEYEEADYIYNQREFVRNTFTVHGVPKQKLFIVHPGVDPNIFQPEDKRDDVFRVIFCGALSLRKGLPYLLQAFCELDLPRSELWLIGSRTKESACLLKKYASPRIVLKGTVSEFELKSLYSQGSVMCCPSIEEGLAMVQAQGMSCGLPLICTDHAGGEVFVREGIDGFVIPIRDVGALKDRIQELYADQVRCRNMGLAARERISRYFTWDCYGAGITNALQRIAARESPTCLNTSS